MEQVYDATHPPERCRRGHRLGPRRVLVSVAHCSCDKVPPSQCHLSWQCRVCGDVLYADGHTDDSSLWHRPRVLLDPNRIQE